MAYVKNYFALSMPPGDCIVLFDAYILNMDTLMLQLNALKIEQLRRQKFLSQQAVADSGGISVRTYNRIASVAQKKTDQLPNVRLSTVDGIARALDVAPLDLLMDA